MHSAQEEASPGPDPARSETATRPNPRTAGSGVRGASAGVRATEPGTRADARPANGRADAVPADPRSPGAAGAPAAAGVRSQPAHTPYDTPYDRARCAGHSRRAVLSSVAIAGTLAATGCGKREAPRPHPDVGVLTAVIAGEENLVALYEAVRRAHGGLAARIDPALAHHREHLSALRRHYRPGTSPAPSAASRKPSPAPDIPGDEDAAIAALRAAERAAARARSTEAGQVAPALAQLLASIGACEAGHDAMLASA